MKKVIVGLFASFAVSVLLLARGPPSEYTLGADSQPQAGVPKGTLTKHQLPAGKIIRASPHDYQVYVWEPVKPPRPGL